MKATKALHDIGQSLWLDNIARELLTSGTLGRYRDDLAVTGLTSNPTIFDHALKHGTDYDAEMRQKLNETGSRHSRGRSRRLHRPARCRRAPAL